MAGESISRILGIVNGTTNYLLTKMTDDGLGCQAALDQAQALGYAEADPTADVSGSDAAAKASILAGLAFGSWIDPGAVFCEGIANLQSRDIGYARELGFVVRLLAIAERVTDSVSVRDHPTLVPLDHPLAGVKGSQNAIYVEGPRIDRLLFTGPGAGGAPTATAVLGDLIDASRELLAGAPVSPRIRVARVRALDFGEVISSWYVRLEVADRPGVLAAIAGVFGQHQVSIRSVRQEGRGEDATLLLITHETTEARHQAAVEELRGVDVVREVASVLRVLDADV